MHNLSLKQLKDSAPHRKNGSPQFPDEGLDAHAIHGGRRGGNKIDVKQSADIGQGLLDSLMSGELEISSVSPPEFNDPARLQKLLDDFKAGKIKQTRVETASIAEDGQPRRKRISIDMTGGPIPRLDITYKLPEH